MSFHQNGSRRYGAVPPAQYGTAQDQGHSVRRQSSFDNGDDAPFFDHSTSLGRTAGAAQEELGIESGQNGYQSPVRGSYGSGIPSSSSAYQYQPPSSPAQTGYTNHSPSTYNPQQFARTLSQSQSQQLSTAYQGNVPAYTGTSGPGGIAPYNPALYQGQSTQSPQIPYNYNQSYASPTVPQSFNHWPPQAPYSQSQQSAVPTPLPPKPAAYLPPPQAAPYAYNGPPYPTDRPPYPTDRPPSQHGRTSHSVRTSTSSEMSYRPMPTPPTPQSAFPNSGLGRHPTLRPLPSAPLEEEPAEEWNEAEMFQTAEEIDQDRLMDDISSNLQQYTNRPSTVHQGYGDLLDGELEERRQYDSEATTLYPVSSMQGSTYDEESDPEAAAGLEAMRIADQQDAMLGGGALFDSYSETPSAAVRPAYQDTSSDSDYAHAQMDMGFYSGGYDGRISYGASNFDIGHENRDEMEDQSRPLPTPQDFQRPEDRNPPLGLGGVVPYGSSSQQPIRNRAYSYDNGDERAPIPPSEANSRLNGRSDSSSPSKDGYNDFYYGPGPNGDRPLPALPSAVEPVSSSTPDFQPDAAYASAQDNQYAWHSEVTQQYSDSNGYEHLLSPTGQPLPRSASHTSSSHHPRAVPPVRAKTDAEERQAAKHRLSKQMQTSRTAGSFDGYDSGNQVPLELPNLPLGGRRKKFNPEKLSPIDFQRCLEPWAMSSVFDWLYEMCGGETDLIDSDLKESMLSDGLVNLFTHKVPTMNTTDAETLSEHVIKSMFAAGLLIRDEEWVKLGAGKISGVLWQLTGSGCYSPKVHEHETSGRCYSRHCSRTLKKVSLQHSQSSRKKEDWEAFYKITEEQKAGKSKKEIERQHILHEVVMSEDNFMDDLDVLRVVYRDSLLSSQPPVITPARLPKMVNEVYGRAEAIKKVNENHLLPQLKYKQEVEGPWITGYASIFREWIRKARQPYLNYAAGLPNAIYQMRREIDRNVLFRQFLKTARDDKRSNRLSWDSFLKCPIVRLQRYTLLLGTELKTMKEDSEEKSNLEKAIEEIKTVTLECNNKVAEMDKVVELLELNSKLVLRPGLGPSDLLLKDPQRELIYKGDLLRAGNNRITWLETCGILYDHYFILAKVIPSKDSNDGKRGERYDVSKSPIPMQLLILEAANDDPVVKRDLKGLGAVTTSARSNVPSAADARSRHANGDRPYTLNHTNTSTSVDSGSTLVTKSSATTNPELDEKRMYPFRIKHLGRAEVYTLYASTAKLREEWCEHIMAAKTRHAASLHEQNAEPFSLRIIADSAFAYDDATASTKKDSGVAVRETPLYRAMREIEKLHGPMRPGPVCRAQVNCATGFTAFTKAMLAIGTDNGVYISEVSNTRGWVRAISIPYVTQIAVLEEFGIFLVLAGKSLIAYHLDVVVPVSDFPPPNQDSARRAPQRLSSSNVSYFATCHMKDRTLVFYKKRDGTSSVFKILEPIFQKSTEKKSRLWGRKTSGGGVTEFFRDYDDFYVAAESYGINIFNKTIAVPTSKGFILLNLDTKAPLSVPDPDDTASATLAPRLAGQKPLGMFRLFDKDFMLVYEDCGVYIDSNGNISRSVILELIGKAKLATMFDGYLILFNEDFVEVRDSKSGRLRQIVAGKDIRCLDAGVEGKGEGGHRSVKFVMTHPEHYSTQLILELVLNDDSRDWKG